MSGQSASTKHSTPPPHGDVRLARQHLLDQPHLLPNALEQHLPPRVEQPAVNPPSWALPDVALGVNHIDPMCCDDQVVDVGPGTGNPAIVQHTKALAGDGAQRRAHRLLTCRTLPPRLGALRFVEDRQQQLAQPRMAGQHALMPLVTAPLELTGRRGPCLTHDPSQRAGSGCLRFGSLPRDGLAACGPTASSCTRWRGPDVG